MTENMTTAQTFGPNPTTVRETDHYQQEYVMPFVEKWDALIDWEKRATGEGSFFIDQLKRYGANKVLDVATGTGFHSVRLLKAGFNVTSVDGNVEMLTKAFDNARRHGCILNTVHTDWRWLSCDIEERFDAIICLGNSLTHLFSERDRRKALAEFYSVLKYDGILILDQRNYDAILDDGFTSQHRYHYCGDQVSVAPEFVDEGLARFKYEFADQSVYYLNMFPLRKKYLRGLMHDVGFQRIVSFSDYQKDGKGDDPDFFTHVAEKIYHIDQPTLPSRNRSYSKPVNVAKDYYDSQDADNFYFTVWGGEDIHIGIYASVDESIFMASRRTVEHIARRLSITPSSHILDIGSGYGGAARFLAKTYGCRVTALNLSEVENQRHRELNRSQALDHLIEVIDGSFEDVPLQDNAVDVIWSQDAILHSGDRDRVIEEVGRLLKAGGDFVFTDPMQADNCPAAVLQPILERIHLESLGSPGFYRSVARRFGLEEIDFDDQTPQLAEHYQRVLNETERRESELTSLVSPDYLNNMKRGLRHWIKGGESGHLVWGVFHFRRR